MKTSTIPTNPNPNPSSSSRLPEAYCPGCAKERPQDFQEIFWAEQRGAIFFTKLCTKHALEMFAENGVQNPRIVSTPQGAKLVCEIGGRTFSSEVLGPSRTGHEEGRVA